MIRKIIRIVVLVPLALVLVLIAVANRHPVTLSLDPFGGEPPAYAITLPLFLLVLGAVIAGVIIGGVAAWMNQGKWRRSVRRLEADTRHLQAETDTLKRRVAAAALPPAPPAA